jgi:tetratricopeptide (TPR) repeat protein
MQARILHKRGDGKAAIQLLNDATKLNPDYIEAYRILLEIAEERKDRTAIIQAASVLNSMSPENPRYTLVLAKTYLELSHFEGSEKFFKKTLSLSPKLAEAYKGLGNVHLAQEEYEKAAKNFKKALDLDSEDIATLNSLGTTYVRMGQFKEGIDKYLVALKLDPHDFRVLFNLGQAYEKKGDLEKAKWYYAQSLIHKSGFEKAVRGLERVEKQLAAGKTDPLDEPEDISGIKPLKKSS